MLIPVSYRTLPHQIQDNPVGQLMIMESLFGQGVKFQQHARKAIIF
ncbi:hypothetical protein [Xenorhabdus bovienii]